MENVQKHFKEKRDDLYSRHRLARTPEDKQGVIRDMQRFNLEARKYRGALPADHGHVDSPCRFTEPGEGVCRIREDYWKQSIKTGSKGLRKWK